MSRSVSKEADRPIYKRVSDEIADQIARGELEPETRLPDVPELIARWLEGYRRVAQVPADLEAEIPTLIMLRRLQLLGWVGYQRQHLDFAREIAPGFASETCRLAEDYLARLGRGPLRRIPRSSRRKGVSGCRSVRFSCRGGFRQGAPCQQALAGQQAF